MSDRLVGLLKSLSAEQALERAKGQRTWVRRLWVVPECSPDAQTELAVGLSEAAFSGPRQARLLQLLKEPRAGRFTWLAISLEGVLSDASALDYPNDGLVGQGSEGLLAALAAVDAQPQVLLLRTVGEQNSVLVLSLQNSLFDDPYPIDHPIPMPIGRLVATLGPHPLSRLLQELDGFVAASKSGSLNTVDLAAFCTHLEQNPYLDAAGRLGAEGLLAVISDVIGSLQDSEPV